MMQPAHQETFSSAICLVNARITKHGPLVLTKLTVTKATVDDNQPQVINLQQTGQQLCHVHYDFGCAFKFCVDTIVCKIDKSQSQQREIGMIALFEYIFSVYVVIFSVSVVICTVP